MNPVLEALRALGGSGSNDEITEKVAEILHLPDEVVSEPHNPYVSSQTELAYRVACAKTYLKRYGILDNSTRGVWALVPEKSYISEVDSGEVVRTVRALVRAEREEVEEGKDVDPDAESGRGDESWRARPHRILVTDLSPEAFERLTRRGLRESGFVQVEVTG
jgi:restriction system protein